MQTEIEQSYREKLAPTFEESENRRQQARSAGMNPNHWYAIEYDHAVKPGQVVEVKFWKRSFALFRTEDGELGCIANRCVHRQLKLSLGQVEGCKLVCPYHGWSYDTEGKVVEIPHELFAKTMPKFKVPHFPLRVRYGLIWLYPGDPELADKTPMPEIPELEGPDAWPQIDLDFTVNGHHSMIIDNVSDFTHEHLHRKFEPFKNAKMTSLRPDGDRVFVEYDTRVGGGKFYKHFVDHEGANTDHITLCYEYPYQWSNTGDRIKHWLFVLPMDERTTRTFYVFYLNANKIPFVPVKRIPRWLMKIIIAGARKFLFNPLLLEDAWAVEAEQSGYERHYDLPIAELNPAVREFQKITIRRWEEHLADLEAKAAAKQARMEARTKKTAKGKKTRRKGNGA